MTGLRHHLRHPSQVVTADADQDRDLADLLARALQETPPYTALIGDQHARRTHLVTYFGSLLASGRSRSWLLRTFADQAGLAAWVIHPAGRDRGPTPVPGIARLFDQRTCLQLIGFEAARAQRRAAVLDGRRHAHLHTVCGRFPLQGFPVETALITERLIALDAEGTPAYADPSRPEIRDLLLAHGFEPANPPGTPVPGTFPLLREPHGP